MVKKTTHPIRPLAPPLSLDDLGIFCPSLHIPQVLLQPQPSTLSSGHPLEADGPPGFSSRGMRSKNSKQEFIPQLLGPCSRKWEISGEESQRSLSSIFSFPVQQRGQAVITHLILTDKMSGYHRMLSDDQKGVSRCGGLAVVCDGNK